MATARAESERITADELGRVLAIGLAAGAFFVMTAMALESFVVAELRKF
jgi:hypothetical protein